MQREIDVLTRRNRELAQSEGILLDKLSHTELQLNAMKTAYDTDVGLLQSKVYFDYRY